MAKITKEAALLYHSQGKPGKIEIVPTKPYSTQTDLSLAYSPDVAEPCLEIEKNPQDAYRYTAEGNPVAVTSNSTAVPGLGDTDALSGRPVMKDRGLLFKIYVGIDAFDIEVNKKDPDKFIEVVKAIAPIFGGINLEDIKAPECFEIERRLKKGPDIPVTHDGQHGTAIVSSTGLINALQVAGKKTEDVKIVANGAGTPVVSCTKLYVSLSARLENIVMPDNKGVISKICTDLNEQKRCFVTDRTDIHTLAEAVEGADVFLGLSKGNVLSQDMTRSVASPSIVSVLTNPTLEILYENAMAAHPDVLTAAGRPDYSNQINNVIGFPYILHGMLDTRAEIIDGEMKIVIVHAVANPAKQPIPGMMNEAYHVSNFTFGSGYFILKPADPRLIMEVSIAVAHTAMESDVARKDTENWDEYRTRLRELMRQEPQLTHQPYDTARRNPQRVVFAEGGHSNMLKAAVEAKSEGICRPIILGNEECIERLTKKLDLSLDEIEIINLRHDREAGWRGRYTHILFQKRVCEGATYEEANDKMFERNYFGIMMAETGDADAFTTGLCTKYSNTIEVVKEAIGIRPEYKHLRTMHTLNSKKGVYFPAGTLINRHPNTSTLIDIAKLADQTIRFFSHAPVISMLSYSSFGSDQAGSSLKVHEAIVHVQEEYPEPTVDGEMQMNFAMSRELRGSRYPFIRLNGKDVNTLVFPNLGSANAGYQLLQAMDPDIEFIGPIQTELNKPIHFTDIESSVRDTVNIIIVAVVDAIVEKKKANKWNVLYPNRK